MSGWDRVLKWDVPVDDQPHKIGTGPVVLVACQDRADVVQVWTHEVGPPRQSRVVQAFATGRVLPQNARTHVGSTLALGGSLVWHVFDVGPS